MQSVIELDIDVPRARVAALFIDPEHDPQWMDDIDRVEPISGEPGMPGSKYRLVPKKGSMVFVATVVAKDPPHEARLILEASQVVVSVKATFVALNSDRTRLRSEEVFRFKGFLNRVFGLVAQKSIKKAHRRHIEAFKRFAEQHERSASVNGSASSPL